MDETAFPLLEQPSPRLCADRIDYFLRDCVGLGLATQVDIERAVDPDVLEKDGELRPLSTLDPEFAAHRDAYFRRKQDAWPMRVVPPA